MSGLFCKGHKKGYILLNYLIKISPICSTKIDNKITELGEFIKDLERQRDAEAGGTMKEIEKSLAERQNADTKMNSSVQHQQEALAKEKKNKKAILKSYEEVSGWVYQGWP